MRRSVAAIAVAVFLSVGCQRDTGSPPPRGRPQSEKPAVEAQVGADLTGLQGDWIDVHALAPKGKGHYYVWVFSEDRVTWRFHNTIDGKAIDAKTIGIGTFKIDPSAMPKKIDFDWGDMKKTKVDFDWGDIKKTPGIYELNGDTLKLATGGTERPRTFEDGELYALRRQKQK
jgi:uncharacterized protein (TIGR03067 family)